jgi:hypothetical protein
MSWSRRFDELSERDQGQELGIARDAPRKDAF